MDQYHGFMVFIQISSQLEDVNSLLAYYTKSTGINRAMAHLKTLDITGQPRKVIPQQSLKILQQQINAWLSEVEKMYQTLKKNWITKQESIEQLKDYIVQVFYETDDLDRANSLQKEQLMERYFSIAKLIEVLQDLCELDKPFKEKKLFCKYRVYQLNDNPLKSVVQNDKMIKNQEEQKNQNKVQQSTQINPKQNQLLFTFADLNEDQIVNNHDRMGQSAQVFPPNTSNLLGRSYIRSSYGIQVQPKHLPDDIPDNPTVYNDEQIKQKVREALSELDFKKHQQAKKKILEALQMMK